MLILLSAVTLNNSFPKSFIRITDTDNPIVTHAFSGNYFGTSWIGIDNDRKLDLSVNRKVIYKNLG